MTVRSAMFATTALPLLALVAGACTSFPTALAEFDSVSRRDQPDVEPDKVEYQETPSRMPWALRQIEGVGVDALLVNLFGIEPEPTVVENPAGFARERLRILVDACGDDLVRCAEVGTRLLWVADLDAYPLNQIEAIKGMGQILARQKMNPLDMVLPDAARSTPEAVARWLETIEAGWPGTRADSALTPERREAYGRALREITERPLPGPVDQRALLRAMARGYELETDAQLRAEALQALQLALFHGLASGLRRGLDSSVADVRETTIHALHHLGGPPAVAFVLWRIAKPAAVAADPRERYDESVQVRRSMVRMCGQLGAERAQTGFRGGPAPVEFLYETLAGDPDRGLRLVALEALAYCLGRPVSFDPTWAREWWVGYVSGRGGGS